LVHKIRDEIKRNHNGEFDSPCELVATMFQRIKNHIFRKWDRDDHLPHPLLKFIPPFLLEVFAVLFMAGIVLEIVRFVISKII